MLVKKQIIINHYMKDFSIFCKETNEKAAKLAVELGIRLIDHGECSTRFVIKFVEDLITLLDTKENLEIELSFNGQIASLRTKNLNSENLIKALGKIDLNTKIYDLTAGLGRDALIMALKGYRVVMIEKHPVLYVLLKNAHQNLLSDYPDIYSRIEVVNADSACFIQDIKMEDNPIFYLDPMFPKRAKSAKVKKEMQVLQNICDLSDNAEDLLKLAVSKGKTVLKRPKLAGELSGLKYHHVISGTKISFFVFERS